MYPPGADTVLVRYGEIGVKSGQVQDRMESRLRDNLVAMLDDRGLRASVEREHTRLYVHTDTELIERVTDTVTDAFGVVSASPATVVDPNLDEICDALSEAATTAYDGGAFAVQARRAGNEAAHPFSSTDIEREGGSAVWQAAEQAGMQPDVDLDDPEVTFRVECRPSRAFVFLEKRGGPGGLPLGTQEPLVALFSGGIDSPVAAWQAMKRGSPIYPLYVDLGQYGGVDHRLRAEESVWNLDRYVPGDSLSLRVAPGGEAIDRIVAETDTGRMLVVRRFMFQIAELVAEKLGAVGVVTGESIGQKSSQTSANLAATSEAIDLPVHRPLLSMDKTGISQLAADIGTFETATMDAGCHRLSPSNPATRLAVDAVKEIQPADLQRLAREAREQLEVVEPTETPSQVS